jgi:hypothetical protein
MARFQIGFQIIPQNANTGYSTHQKLEFIYFLIRTTDDGISAIKISINQCIYHAKRHI